MGAAERSPGAAGAACEGLPATAIPEGVEVEADKASMPESVRSTWSSRTEDDGDGDGLEAEIDLDILDDLLAMLQPLPPALVAAGSLSNASASASATRSLGDAASRELSEEPGELMDDDEPDSEFESEHSCSGSDSERCSSRSSYEDDESWREKSFSRSLPHRQPPATGASAVPSDAAAETDERLPEETCDSNASAVKASSSSNLKRRPSTQSPSSKLVTVEPQVEAAGRVDASTAQHAASKNPVEMLERLDLDILEQVKQRLLVELHKVDPGVTPGPGAPPTSTSTSTANANASLTVQQQPHAPTPEQQTEQETCAQATPARTSSEPLIANPLERSPAECTRAVVASRTVDGVEVQPPEQQACGQTLAPADQLANESSLLTTPATHAELEQTTSSDAELIHIRVSTRIEFSAAADAKAPATAAATALVMSSEVADDAFSKARTCSACDSESAMSLWQHTDGELLQHQRRTLVKTNSLQSASASAACDLAERDRASDYGVHNRFVCTVVRKQYDLTEGVFRKRHPKYCTSTMCM